MSRRPEHATISDAVVAAQPSFMAAINLMVSASGLEDKEVYMPLDIDPGHWTRMRRGEAHFPTNKIDAAMELCGNDIPLRWLAYRCGYELKPLMSDLERQLHAEREENRRLKDKLETITQFVATAQGRR